MKANQFTDLGAPHAPADPFLQKLIRPPERERDDSLTCGCQLKIGCATLAKKLGLLLIFHSLNVVVAVGGVIFASVMLLSTALAPAWFLLFTYGCAICLVLGIAIAINAKLFTPGFLLLIGLWVFSMTDSTAVWYTGVYPGCAMSLTGAGLLFYFAGKSIATPLIKADVRLVKFVEGAGVSDSATEPSALDAKECVNRFEFPWPFGELKFLLPHIALTRRLWALIFYYAVLKVIVGLMSAVLLMLVLVQPIAAICTLGHDPFVGIWVSSPGHPVVYSIIIVSLWLFGIVGLEVTAKLSIKMTALVCGPWGSPPQQPTGEGDIEAALPSPPTPTSSIV